jgi:hypothetical protein
LSPIGDVASGVENVSAAYSDATVAPHEYFDQSGCIGQTEGKLRVAVYVLCNRCSQLPDFRTRVEQSLLEDAWPSTFSPVQARTGSIRLCAVSN